ncbi:uncharacterized protein LOC122509941 isoform X2 [Leptopilina heterotoma]|uniref:uncharacterized protein LOC122509941 isoform X2 n=1 Tax=Leptopilina heterotoma TaxID=63436 RepID=UPI001CA7BA0E|nr:uncharacterized protein LOC122509941 isoform X2 [Leptopilina heterotoma]
MNYTKNQSIDQGLPSTSETFSVNQGFSNSSSPDSNQMSSAFNRIADYMSDSDYENQEFDPIIDPENPNLTDGKESTPSLDNDVENELFQATKNTPESKAT